MIYYLAQRTPDRLFAYNMQYVYILCDGPPWGRGLHNYVLYCIQRTYPKLLDITKHNMDPRTESWICYIVSKPALANLFSQHFPIIFNCLFNKGPPWTTGLAKEWEDIRLRATSHTRLRARDHHTSSTLIGGKGRAGPSSLHTTLEGPLEYVNARWM